MGQTAAVGWVCASRTEPARHIRSERVLMHVAKEKGYITLQRGCAGGMGEGTGRRVDRMRETKGAQRERRGCAVGKGGRHAR